MSKFRKIVLINFQSNKRTVIDFIDGVNVLIGTSDSGKSAIVRSIDYTVNNNIPGDSFVSHWVKRTKKGNVLKDNCSIEIHTDNGVIQRLKGKDNTYIVNGHELKAFGRGSVPEEVSAFFNMGDINIQLQSDSHKYLNASAGEVARALNSLVDLKIIDTTSTNINRRVSSLDKKREHEVQEIDTIKKDIRKMSFVNDLDKKLGEAEKLDDKQKVLIAISSNCGGILNDICATDEEIKDKEKCTKQEEALSIIGKHLKESIALQEFKKKIITVLEKITTVDEGISKVSNVIIHEEHISALDSLDEQRRNEVKKMNISSLLSSLFRTNKGLDKLSNLTKNEMIEKALDDIGQFTFAITQMKEEKERLEDILSSLADSMGAIEENNKVSVLSTENVEEYEDILADRNNTFKEVKNLTEQITSLNKRILETKGTLRQLKKKYKDEMPATCPVCGGKTLADK